jgi:hypothetical protein
VSSTSPLRSQPQFLTRVDWASPLTRGLQILFDGITQTNLVNGIPGVKIGNFTNATEYYKGISNNGTSGINTDYGITPTSELTLLVVARGSVSAFQNVWDDDNFSGAALGGGNRCFQFRFNTTNGIDLIGFVGGTATTCTLTSTSNDTIKPIVGRISKAGVLAIDTPGKSTTAAQSGANNSSNLFLRMGEFKGGAQGLNGSIFWAAAWNRALSDTEVKLLLANPFQLATPRRTISITAAVNLAYYFGSLVESLPVTTWAITASRCNDNVNAGVTSTTGATFTLPESVKGPAIVTCAPKINYSWTATRAATIGDFVIPTNLTATPNLYTCTTAGTTGGAQPTWPSSGTVTDGSVVWTYVAPLVDPISKLVVF